MAYIYKITNDINNKLYIGKTQFDLNKRFEEHCHDAFSRTKEHRPLYSAMRKYGIEHFHIELVEETNNPNERETYWIEYYNSYGSTGYNATKGGDGKAYINFEYAKKRYEEVQNIALVAKEMNIDKGHLGKMLRDMGIKVLSSTEVNQRDRSKMVNQYDKQGNFIKSFSSAIEAARAIGKITSTSNGASSHITDCCRGKQKTAYGYIWKFSE